MENIKRVNNHENKIKQARGKTANDQVAVGCSTPSTWLRQWRVFSKQITKKKNHNNPDSLSTINCKLLRTISNSPQQAEGRWFFLMETLVDLY